MNLILPHLFLTLILNVATDCSTRRFCFLPRQHFTSGRRDRPGSPPCAFSNPPTSYPLILPGGWGCHSQWWLGWGHLVNVITEDAELSKPEFVLAMGFSMCGIRTMLETLGPLSHTLRPTGTCECHFVKGCLRAFLCSIPNSRTQSLKCFQIPQFLSADRTLQVENVASHFLMGHSPKAGT